MIAAARQLLAVLVLAAPLARAGDPAEPPRNPYLADSVYPLGHSNSAQIDSTSIRGPLSPSHPLPPAQAEYAMTGPGHLGAYVSPPYPDGRRVIWTNGPHDIVKLDHDSLRVLARYPLAGYAPYGEADAAAFSRKLETYGPLRRLYLGFTEIRKMLPTDLSTVYCLVDRDGRFFAGGADGLTVYGDARPGDAGSPIAVRGRFHLPPQVTGSLVGMNMTYDGWIVFATDDGYLVTVSRDLSSYRWVALPHREEAAEYNARMAGEHRTGYNWVRNGMAVDADGGIYIAANNWIEKIVWNGQALSAAPADGAWAEPYANGTRHGTGSTPVLMGFGATDHLVAFTDGEPLMNLTLMWRDRIPPGWQPPPGALSPRIAGRLPVTLGDPGRKALQSEQAVVVAGNDMVVVNNEPATMPFYLPDRAKGLLISLLGDDPAYTPHGMEKYQWDPASRSLRRAWTNRQVSSPNCVPYVSTSARRVYTMGVDEQRRWTLEAVDLDSGDTRASYPVGGPRFNTMFSALYLDPRGRIVAGGMFGTMRLNPDAAPQ